MDKTPLIVIVGPTAAGKTDLAIKVAKKLNSEIVSADSMQIYRYMDIGTAKPTMDERQGIPHHMIDIVDPDEAFNVALYQRSAKAAIKKIAEDGKIPILVGGTGLYVNSIIYPMDFTDAVEDPVYRSKLNKILDTHGNQYLHNLLKEVDPDTAARLHHNDTRRVIRAMEVYHLTGKTMMEFKQDYRKAESPYELLLFGLTMDRQKLYERINMRVDMMVDAGLVKEVKSLLDKGYTKDMISMQGLGYKEIIYYLKGLATLEEALEILKRETRKFAKRQMTWFRREKRIHWLDADLFNDRQAMSDWVVSTVQENESF